MGVTASGRLGASPAPGGEQRRGSPRAPPPPPPRAPVAARAGRRAERGEPGARTCGRWRRRWSGWAAGRMSSARRWTGSPSPSFSGGRAARRFPSRRLRGRHFPYQAIRPPARRRPDLRLRTRRLPAPALHLEEIKEETEVKEPIEEEKKPEPTKKIKTQELVQCPRCKRWMTEKTLKFTHEKTCKEKAEVYIPKTLQNKKNKAKEIVGTVKEAIEITEQEKEVKRPKDIFKPVRQTLQPPVRQSSQPPAHQLEPIQERVPLYSDLRRERLEQHKNKMTYVFEKAFN